LNISNHAVVSFSMLALSMTSYQAFANGQVQIHHALLDQITSDSNNTVTLTLRINNLSNNDLKNVKLLPSGNEFCVEEKSKHINVGHLPAQSESIIQWTATTPVATEYFSSGMPVFFQLSAKQASDERYDLPLYSQGDK